MNPNECQCDDGLMCNCRGEPERISAVNSVCIMKVIRVSSVRGNGTPASPVRTQWEYFTLEGHLLARTTEWNPYRSRDELPQE